MTRYLFPPEVEKAFVQVAIDLKVVIVVDGIDTLSDPAGFRISYHDSYGPLPEIMIADTREGYAVRTLSKVCSGEVNTPGEFGG
jgi:hypothetical protein